MRTLPRGLRVKLGWASCFSLLWPLPACEVHFDTARPAAPAPAQTAPPPAPTATAAVAPAKPIKVIALHVRRSGASGTTAGDPPPTASDPPMPNAACLDASPALVESCTAMAAPDPSCASMTMSRQRCAAFQSDYNPKVATVAIHCMTALTGAQQCDPSQVDNCAKRALVQACADGSVTQLCGIAASVCKSSAADCSTLVSGLNEQGKQQVAQCVAQGCTAGLTGCLQSLR